MGAKYLPTNTDQKATKRFEKSHLTQSKFIKPTGKPPAPKAKTAPKAKKK